MNLENIKDRRITIVSVIIVTIFVIFIFRRLPQYISMTILMFFIVGVFVLYVYKFQKEEEMRYYFLGEVNIGVRGPRHDLPTAPILVNFDKIPNAAKLVEEASWSKDWAIKIGVCKAIGWHFDKIPNAPEILKKLMKDESIDVRDETAEVFRKHLDKIPKKITDDIIIKNSRIIGDIDDTPIRYTEVLKKYFDKIFKRCKNYRNIGK
ncbi:MAG: hypothetical protein CVT89_03770 [Candidatus Altiarchaeales archaeon HGW-Altiarchaeales-2]|nr:MAG: hypothetical protein CVT89_03770 [Candidatus Altiarchaeales archaeon HGW-Altiarchaeales-2]